MLTCKVEKFIELIVVVVVVARRHRFSLYPPGPVTLGALQPPSRFKKKIIFVDSPRGRSSGSGGRE